MKNTQIDAALRKAFHLGESYRVALQTGDLNEAHDTWGKLEQYIAEVMIGENEVTNLLDEADVRRKMLPSQPPC